MLNRILIAGVLASTASVASAASSVTLFGIVDAGIQYTKFKGQKATTGMADGTRAGSRWGLRGTEDLGGGTQAVFLLDSGFTVFNGRSAQGNRLFGRSAYLGLANANWGEFRAGRQSIASTDIMGVFTGTAASYKLSGSGASINTMTFTRTDSALKYLTPKIGGFEGIVSYAFNAALPYNTDGNGNVAAERDTDRLLSVAGRYGVGPFRIGGFYDRAFIGSGTSSNGVHYDIKPEAYGLGATYKFGDYTLHGAAAQHKDAYINGAPTGNPGQAAVFKGGKVNGYLLAVTGKVGPGDLILQVQYSDPNSRVIRAGQKAHSQQVYTAVYNYPLSKRTNLYGVASYLQGAWFDSVGSNGQTVRAKDWNATQLTVGLQHAF